MVETPKLSSLAGELLKFFLLSSLLLGVVISFLFFFLGNVNPYYAVGAGFGVAVLWVFLSIFWMKNKIEELFGRLMYVIDILEERQREKMVIPIPLYEEVLEVVHSIRELVKSFEEKYERNIRELEEQLEVISENAATILKALEELHEGRTKVELPTGLDPVGAIGQSLEHLLELYHERFSRIKRLTEECRRELETLVSLLKEKNDKIDVSKLKEGIDKLVEVQGNIERELRFLKDI